MKGVVLCIMLSLTAPWALAELRITPVGQQGNPAIDPPARGDSRLAVLERFGLPDQEHPAVGTPPITRWDYRTFSVYFENDHVVSAVRHHDTPAR
ncbi:phosphodiesterase [Stutzerimonas urumqiensis]|uniref:phosphodiesterase n=1 Tax=Stutzerimonas urumqiensis TaxID=638269 RepID=UPI003DA5EA3A